MKKTIKFIIRRFRNCNGALAIDARIVAEGWCEVIHVSAELVSFRWTYVFASDGEVITSDSTLRFRDRSEIERSLEKAGYVIHDVRDAPDRPRKEFVFIASRPFEDS